MKESIEKLLAARKWAQARALIQDELLSDPTDHWLWTALGLTFYEQREYDRALKCSRRAVELAPACPLALWDYAGALSMTGHESAAMAIWTILLEMDLEEIAYVACGEGMDWALQLVNDVHYRMGHYFQWKGRTEQARASFAKYLHNHGHGVGSLYDAEPVKKYMAKTAVETA